MLGNLDKYQIILASNSPRRKELMSGLGVDYVVRTLPDVDESYPADLAGAEIPEYISREKADAYRSIMQPGELLITADTIVWLDGKVLESRKVAKERSKCSVLCPVSHIRCSPVFVLRPLNGKRALLLHPMWNLMFCPKRKSGIMWTNISLWIKRERMECRNGSDI